MKVAVITGGNRGIGKAIAELFQRNGFITIIGSKRIINNINNEEGSYHLDVSSPSSCKDFIDKVIYNYGKIDVLINNAGILDNALTVKMTDEQWNNVIQTNLTGTFNMTRGISQIMLNQGYGNIINISSVVVDNGSPGQANYVASKAGIEGLTKVWAKEFSYKANIRVNCISPGFINTEMIKNIPEDITEEIKKRILLKRLGEKEDIAKLALFLASDDSSYITGEIIHINGGLVL
jgi:3-oxoacyl-[acyl-carrier protein] reductase